MTVQISSQVLTLTGEDCVTDTYNLTHLVSNSASIPSPTGQPNAQARIPRLHVNSMAEISDQVTDEMVAQLQKWGIQNHPSVTRAATLNSEEWYITGLSVEEAKKETDRAAKHGNLCWPQILHEECAESMAECIALVSKPNDPETLARLRKELIQVAAVAMSWALSIDRNQK